MKKTDWVNQDYWGNKMGLSNSQKFELWLAQRNNYEERAWKVFRLRREAEFPHLVGKNGLTWGWEFDSINEDGVNFSYDNYGDHETHGFAHELLWDDDEVEQDLVLLRGGVAERKRIIADRERKKDLADLARLKEMYEGEEC